MPAGIKMALRSILPKFAQNSQPFTVLVEGNIGSGKTTFLNSFRKHQDVCILAEPVEKWRNCCGVNLLDFMYKDPLKWSMSFQMYVTITMLERHTALTDKKIKLLERSMFSSRYCFVENMHANGNLHPANYNILQEWYDFIDKSIHIQADLIIYLRASPEVVYNRMKRRSREEETLVPLEYLQQLHVLHEEWLVKKIRGPDIPVLILDANLDLDYIDQEYKKSEEKIFLSQSQLERQGNVG